MRKTFVILGLTAALLAASATDAFAQRRGGGGGRGGRGGGWNGGSNWGVSIGVPGLSGYYGNGYGSGYGYGRGYGYDRGYYSGYYSPEYYSSPDYYVSPDYYSSPSYYSQPSSTAYDPNSATVNVIVPAADAQVWFDGSATQQRGMQRTFHTPALQGAGTYTVKAAWNVNGRNMEQTRTVQVRPGQPVTIDFRAENVPQPRNPQSNPPPNAQNPPANPRPNNNPPQ